MRKYVAGKAAGGGAQEQPDTREWVFGLLAKPRYRERMEQLERLDLRRRPGCEPCLRALVVDEWTPDALYHMGWCESCRSAAIALGMHDPAAAGAWYRRRAAWLAVAAVAAIAAPLVGSQVLSSRDSQVAARGGSASSVRTVPHAELPALPAQPCPAPAARRSRPSGAPGVSAMHAAAGARARATRRFR